MRARLVQFLVQCDVVRAYVFSQFFLLGNLLANDTQYGYAKG
jgi:hypothetical protein